MKKWNLEPEKEESIRDTWITALFGAVGMIGLGIIVIFLLAGFQD